MCVRDKLVNAVHTLRFYDQALMLESMLAIGLMHLMHFRDWDHPQGCAQLVAPKTMRGALASNYVAQAPPHLHSDLFDVRVWVFFFVCVFMRVRICFVVAKQFAGFCLDEDGIPRLEVSS